MVRGLCSSNDINLPKSATPKAVETGVVEVKPVDARNSVLSRLKSELQLVHIPLTV